MPLDPDKLDLISQAVKSVDGRFSGYKSRCDADVALDRLDAAFARGDLGLPSKEAIKGGIKKGAAATGRALQRSSNPLAVGGLVGGMIPGPVGAAAFPIGVLGGAAAGIGGRALEKAATGKVSHSSFFGGPSTEEAERRKKALATKHSPAFRREILGREGKPPATAGRTAHGLVARAKRGIGNWADRRRLKGQQRELEWALGGEADARQYAGKPGSEGWVQPGYWAGEAKRRQGNIAAIQKRIAGRGDAVKKAPRRKLSVPEHHQLRIAKQTLKMPPAMAGVMGGPSPREAKQIVNRLQHKQRRGDAVVAFPAHRTQANREREAEEHLNRLHIAAAFHEPGSPHHARIQRKISHATQALGPRVQGPQGARGDDWRETARHVGKGAKHAARSSKKALGYGLRGTGAVLKGTGSAVRTGGTYAALLGGAAGLGMGAYLGAPLLGLAAGVAPGVVTHYAGKGVRAIGKGVSNVGRKLTDEQRTDDWSEAARKAAAMVRRAGHHIRQHAT